MYDTRVSGVLQERPRRIDKPHRNWVIRGLNAMTTFNDAQKRLWLEMMHLDQKKSDGSEPGCYAGFEILAQRMGWKGQKAERVRRQLKDKGFAVSQDRPGYLNDTWYPTIPVPLPAIPILFPTVEQGVALAKQLDEANLPTSRGTLVGDSPTFSDTTYLPPEGLPYIRTEYRTEPRTEPTEGIQEEEVGREEKKRRDFREVLGRDPTSVEMELCNPHPTGTDG